MMKRLLTLALVAFALAVPTASANVVGDGGGSGITCMYANFWAPQYGFTGPGFYCHYPADGNWWRKVGP